MLNHFNRKRYENMNIIRFHLFNSLKFILISKSVQVHFSTETNYSYTFLISSSGAVSHEKGRGNLKLEYTIYFFPSV